MSLNLIKKQEAAHSRDQALNQFKSDFYKAQVMRADKKTVKKKGSSYILGTEASILANYQKPLNTSDISLSQKLRS